MQHRIRVATTRHADRLLGPYGMRYLHALQSCMLHSRPQWHTGHLLQALRWQQCPGRCWRRCSSWSWLGATRPSTPGCADSRLCSSLPPNWPSSGAAELAPTCFPCLKLNHQILNRHHAGQLSTVLQAGCLGQQAPNSARCCLPLQHTSRSWHRCQIQAPRLPCRLVLRLALHDHYFSWLHVVY